MTERTVRVVVQIEGGDTTEVSLDCDERELAVLRRVADLSHKERERTHWWMPVIHVITPEGTEQ